MGLSRKLGGGNSRLEVPSHVDYTWSTQAYTIRDILTKFRLPCVIQCSGDAGTVLWADFRFDMRQPLLLHAARTVRKIHARSLQIRDPSGELEEFGPPLAIPEDYDGWFYPVERHRDPSALPRHTRVEGAADSPSRQFLVTTTLPAFTPAKGVAPSSSSSGSSKHVQHEVTIGEVLTKVGVMKGDPSVAPSSPSALVRGQRQSLRCVDENQHEIIIPFHHRAQLYDVAENYGPPGTTTKLSGSSSAGGDSHTTGPSSPGVVHTQTLVTVGNRYLPRVFRHVLGELPALAQTFTGLLRCYSVFTEETVMAATMIRVHPFSTVSQHESSCLELVTDSSAKFKIALNASELKKTYQYAQALKTCEELAPSYVRAIKTSFTVQPTVLDLEDVDVSVCDSGQEQSEVNSLGGSANTHCDGAAEATAMNRDVLNEYSVSDLQMSRTDPGTTDPSDHGVLEIDDVVDNESITTDDVPNSLLDTASLSDGTDILYSESVSDVGDVEANSEFDFTWGQLKRAKSFTGSISSLPDDDDSGTSSTVTDSEYDSSAVAQDSGLDASQNSTLNRDANSSTSEDTVVLRTSAPSPVYANVPKKLTVYNSGQSDDTSFEVEPPANPSVLGITDVQSVDSTMVDNSVRSVWNITPTVEAHQERQSLPNDGVAPNKSAAQPIWWGDSNTTSLKNIDSPLQNSTTTTFEHAPKISDKFHAADHQQLSAKSSVNSTASVQSAVAPQSLCSSKLSLRSEGSAQDLVIQRLERALNNATTFLSSHGPQEAQPLAPPRRWKSHVMNIHQTGSFQSDQDGDRQHGMQAQLSHDTAVQRILSQTNSRRGSSLSVQQPLSLHSSNSHLQDQHTLYHPDQYPHDQETQDNSFTDYGNIQGSTAHRPSLDSHHATSAQTANDDTEAQIDLDFVKTLGDRLLAVSRKSSLPKYQRLQPDIEVNVHPGHADSGRQFRKKKQRAGLLPTSMTQDGAVVGLEEVSNEDAEASSIDMAVSEDWDCADFRQRDVTLTDLDLLEEEVV